MWQLRFYNCQTSSASPTSREKNCRAKNYSVCGRLDGGALTRSREASATPRYKLAAVRGLAKTIAKQNSSMALRNERESRSKEEARLEAMRKSLAARRRVHQEGGAACEGSLQSEREVLLHAFERIDRRRAGKVDVDGFIAVWRELEVRLSRTEAAALFNKFGQDKSGLMPYEVFTEAICVGRARLRAREGNMRQQAYTKGKQQEPADFNGKIVYPPCRTGVFPPTKWSSSLTTRSAKPPDARLQLDFVYGYNGTNNLTGNVFYINTGEVAYYVATLGVLLNKDSRGRSQRFFLGHDQEITCIAVTRGRDTVATGQNGRKPVVLVWSPKKLEELARLEHPPGYDGIGALTFSADGVLGVRWNPFATASDFATYGYGHIKFWRCAVKSKDVCEVVGKPGRFGQIPKHDVLSAVYLPSGLVVGGCETGDLCIWQPSATEGGVAVRLVKAHDKGPEIKRPIAPPPTTFGGVRALRLRDDQRVPARLASPFPPTLAWA
eukprot:gene14159-16744_t